MLKIIKNNKYNGFKIKKIYLYYFPINNNRFFKLTLFLFIIRAEATLIYNAVIIRNFINQTTPMIITKIKTI